MTAIRPFGDAALQVTLGAEPQRTNFRAPLRQAFTGRLNAVRDGVAHQLDQRIVQPIRHAPIDADLCSADLDAHQLAFGARQARAGVRDAFEHGARKVDPAEIELSG